MTVQESAYEGAVGMTAEQDVHIADEAGDLRSVRVYCRVNVQTHPDLSERVMAGTLHHLQDGRQLAVPFVYHDPTARRFAVVIPESLAHQELKERARVMAEVAEDTSAPVPGYVRDVQTVFGVPGLLAFLGATSDAPEGLAVPTSDHTHDAEIVPTFPPGMGRWHEVNDSGGLGDSDATVVTELPQRLAASDAVQVQETEVEAMSERPSTVPPPLKARKSGPPPLRSRNSATPPPLRTDRTRDRETQRGLRSRASDPPPLPSSAPEDAPRPSQSPSVFDDRPSAPALSDASGAELTTMLKRPEARIAAIKELCLRGHHAAMTPIVACLEELSPGEAAEAVPHLLTFGERIGDPLIHGLGSPSESVRQLCALGLGRLKLRRSLVPLLKQLDLEPAETWSEIARALGDFGPAALRAVVSGYSRAQHPERLMVCLAHLANHGCAESVESLEKDRNQALSLAARQALSRRSRIEWEDQCVREGGTLVDHNPAARLSQLFYESARKLVS